MVALACAKQARSHPIILGRRTTFETDDSSSPCRRWGVRYLRVKAWFYICGVRIHAPVVFSSERTYQSAGLESFVTLLELSLYTRVLNSSFLEIEILL